MRFSMQHSLPAAVVVGIGFVAGCTSQPVAESPESDSASRPAEAAQPVAQPAPVAPPPRAPASPAAAAPPAPGGPGGYAVQCNGETTTVASVLQPIVSSLVAQKIPYGRSSPKEWRDCSGNFLRLSSYVAAACPEHAEQLVAAPGVSEYVAGGSNTVALERKARSSRGIAQWYHEQGRFTPIYYDDAQRLGDTPADLRKYRHLIQPGTVLWYSRGRPLAAAGVDPLFTRSETGINHMGTVTAVERNDSGEVVRYHIYHGHGKDGTPASVTKAHYWKWPDTYLAGGTKSYPPFGYWKQRVVGIGTLVEPLAAGGGL